MLEHDKRLRAERQFRSIFREQHAPHQIERELFQKVDAVELLVADLVRAIERLTLAELELEAVTTLPTARLTAAEPVLVALRVRR